MILDQSMLDFCYTKWHCDGFFSEYLRFPLSVSFHQCSIITRSPMIDAIQFDQLTVSVSKQFVNRSRPFFLHSLFMAAILSLFTAYTVYVFKCRCMCKLLLGWRPKSIKSILCVQPNVKLKATL